MSNAFWRKGKKANESMLKKELMSFSFLRGLRDIVAKRPQSYWPRTEYQRVFFRFRRSSRSIPMRLIKACAGFKVAVTVEEHSIYGGLGGLVAEILSERSPRKVVRVGIDDRWGESASNDFSAGSVSTIARASLASGSREPLVQSEQIGDNEVVCKITTNEELRYAARE